MSGTELNAAISLKLHAYGLTQLHDPNWTGTELFDRLKQHTRGREEPRSLLFRPLRKGLLYHLGLWLYHDYFISDTYRMSLGGEYRLWYLEDLLELLQTARVPALAAILNRLRIYLFSRTRFRESVKPHAQPA